MAHHDNYDEKYTEPELRRRLKDEIMKGDKGGDPGEWSARKSQLLVQEYEKHGGGYKNKEKDEAAHHLEEWQEQEWQTVDGDDRARQDGTVKRYLPKEVWDKLSPAEKREAERTKERGTAKGEQHVAWTPAIERVMDEVEHNDKHEHHASKHDQHEPTKAELQEQARELGISGRSKMDKDELERAVNDAEKHK